MAGFATEAALQTALDAGNLFTGGFYKVMTATGFASDWRVGTLPAAGADPATTPGTAYESTVGGIVLPDTSPLRKFVTFISIRSDNTQARHIGLWDRLVGVSGIAVNSTGNKTINSTALTRYTDGAGVQVFLEITTAGTTTAPIISMNSYTNQAGTATRAGATITFPAVNSVANTLVGPMPLQAGDTGVRSVETLNVATAGGGSGVVNVILVKPLVSIGQIGTTPFERLSPRPYHAPVRLFDGATVMVAQREAGASGGNLIGIYTVVYG